MHVLPIENCEFAIDCPRRLDELDTTDNPKVRYCTHCKCNVYHCESVQELENHRNAGHCVALSFTPCTPENTSEGDVVRVTCGNFENQEATIERLDIENDAARVMYHVLGRVLPTWIPMSELGQIAAEGTLEP